MNTKIDLKSAIVGLGVGMLVMLGVAAASSSGSVGRYQMTSTQNHALVIDTVTGRVWQAYWDAGQGATTGGFYEPKSQ